jgi:hypothetical protein
MDQKESTRDKVLILTRTYLVERIKEPWRFYVIHQLTRKIDYCKIIIISLIESKS